MRMKLKKNNIEKYLHPTLCLIIKLEDRIIIKKIKTYRKGKKIHACLQNSWID